LVRIHACHAWGRGFESRPDRKNLKSGKTFEVFSFLEMAYINFLE